MSTGIITYEFAPGSDVWVIYNQAGSMQKTNYSRSGCATAMDGSGVTAGKVVYYRADLLQTGLKEWYGIVLKGADSTRDFDVMDVFPSMTHAMVEYENRIGGDTFTNDNAIRVNQMTYESEAPNTTHIVNHEFGLIDVGVEVYDTSGVKIVPNDITLFDENNVIVGFADESINCKVIVTGRVDYTKEELNSMSNRTSQYVYVSKTPNTVHNVNHNFGQMNVITNVYDVNGYGMIAGEVVIVDENNVRVTLGTESKMCKVVVIGSVDYS